MSFDPKSDYPLGSERPDLVSTPGGIPLADVTLDALRDGRIAAAEIRATPGTLRMQAQVALAAGRAQLAQSLERAAELADVPDDVLLAIYTALRPRRSTATELQEWAVVLEGFGASETADFVRKAALASGERGLLARA